MQTHFLNYNKKVYLVYCKATPEDKKLT